jgi:Family of unknown function (DUF6095)
METNKTDKDVLVKGLKMMGITLICMFLGPSLFYMALINQDKPLYIPILIAAAAVSILAIYLAFKGINTILDSLFKNKKN